MQQKLNHNIRLFLRYAKEIHCINEYYNDFENFNVSKKNKPSIINFLSQFSRSEPEDFIGLGNIFPIWINSKSKRDYWLNYYRQIKNLNKDKILNELIKCKNKKESRY